MTVSLTKVRNLMVPAFGSTQALKVAYPDALGNYYTDFKTVQIESVYFSPQSMTVDLRGFTNDDSVVVEILPLQYSVTLLGGTLTTFNFPSPANLIVQFFPTSGITNFDVYYYDYPSFPQTISTQSQGNVTVTNTLSASLVNSTANPVPVEQTGNFVPEAQLDTTTGFSTAATAAGATTILASGTAFTLFNVMLKIRESTLLGASGTVFAGELLAELTASDSYSGNVEILAYDTAWLGTAVSTVPIHFDGVRAAWSNGKSFTSTTSLILNLSSNDSSFTACTQGGVDVFINKV